MIRNDNVKYVSIKSILKIRYIKSIRQNRAQIAKRTLTKNDKKNVQKPIQCEITDGNKLIPRKLRSMIT